MSTNYKIIFYHGGPGLNSNSEKNLLTDLYLQQGIKLCTWNEPSSQRSQGDPFSEENAYANWLESARQFLIQHYTGDPLILMGHSFGCQTIANIARLHPEKISAVILVAPTFGFSNTDRNIFTLMTKDYLANNENERSKEIEDITNTLSGTYNENVQRGWTLTLENPRFFSYYWHNTDKTNEYLQYYTQPEYALDVQSYFAIRKSLFTIPVEKKDIKALVLSGKHEQVALLTGEMPALSSHFPNYTITEFEHSGHYPHIEEAGSVLATIKNFIGKLNFDD